MLYATSERSPFDSFLGLRRDLDRLFKEALPIDASRSVPLAFSPTIEVEENDTGLTLRAEVPGVEPQNLNVAIDGDVLTISGERETKFGREASFANDGSRHRSERRFGKFSRALRLSDQYDTEKIDAQHSNGILTLHIGKKDAAQPRRIAVEAK